MTAASLLPLANHLWQSTLCAGAAWVLTLALRRNRAAVRYAVWMAASLKLLIPFALLVSVGSHLGWRPAIVQAQTVHVITAVSQPFAPEAEARDAAVRPRRTSYVPTIAVGIWLCGIAMGLVFWARLVWQMRAITRAATPLDLNLPIPARSTAAPLEPGVYGILRPVLLLPRGIGARLQPAQLEAVLVHELCHARRKDNLTGALHMLVEVIFWFHRWCGGCDAIGGGTRAGL
jgi:bla regulator protein blaR1